MRKYLLYLNFAVIFLCSLSTYWSTNLVVIFINGICIGSNIVMALYNSGVISYGNALKKEYDQQLAMFDTSMQELFDKHFTEDIKDEIFTAMEAKYHEIQNRKES